MARKTKEQIEAEKAELARQKRSATRAARRARKAMEAEASSEKEGAVTHQRIRMAAAPTEAPKKVTLARENLSSAFDLMGGVNGLVRWGRKNPTEFYRIWARLIPKDAVEDSARMPLEDLLGKLAERSSQSVAEAATEIGEEILAEAGRKVAVEDAAAGLRATEDGITIQ